MAKTKLSAAAYVERGYGQVEPNHLSAQHTGQIYAQLPAKADIEVLENGQFVKYDYTAGVVDFSGKGEWMLVFNPVKVYRDYLGDADFAMLKSDYAASVYAPNSNTGGNYRLLDYTGVVKPADPYEVDSTEDPMYIELSGRTPALMPEGSTMVPTVYKTNVGDIFTTNMVAEETLAVGDVLSPRDADGILAIATDGAMQWEVVKVYTMPDGQKGVKIMRIA